MEVNMHIKNKRGQSTVEYILLVTAVVGVMIVFTTNKNGVFQTKLNSVLGNVADDMDTGATGLHSSHQPTTAQTVGGGVPPTSLTGFNVTQ